MNRTVFNQPTSSESGKIIVFQRPLFNQRFNIPRKRDRHEVRNEKTQLEEEPVRAHEGPCHPCGQAGVDPRLWQEGHGVVASQAQAVQHHLQEDHVQPVRPVQVVGNRVIARTNHHATRSV